MAKASLAMMPAITKYGLHPAGRIEYDDFLMDVPQPLNRLCGHDLPKCSRHQRARPADHVKSDRNLVRSRNVPECAVSVISCPERQQRRGILRGPARYWPRQRNICPVRRFHACRGFWRWFSSPRVQPDDEPETGSGCAAHVSAREHTVSFHHDSLGETS